MPADPPPLLSKNALRIRRCRDRARASGLSRLDDQVRDADKPLVLALLLRLREDPSPELRARLRTLLGDATAAEGNPRASAPPTEPPPHAPQFGEGRVQRPMVRSDTGQRPDSAGLAFGGGSRAPEAGAAERGAARGRTGMREPPARPVRQPVPVQAGLPPTEDQLVFARSLAERKQLTIPAGLDRAGLHAWINTNR